MTTPYYMVLVYGVGYTRPARTTQQQTYTLYNLHPIALTYTQQSDSQAGPTYVHALGRASMVSAYNKPVRYTKQKLTEK